MIKKPQGQSVRHNGKDYIVCENGRIYAVQQKRDNGFCFGRAPGITEKYILLDPAAGMYSTITKKIAGTLGPNTAWNQNKKERAKRKNNSRTITVTG